MDLEILEKQLVGVDDLAAHFLDLVLFDLRAVEVGIEETKIMGRRARLFEGRCARQQQDLMRDLGG